MASSEHMAAPMGDTGGVGLFHRLFDKLFPAIRFWHERIKGNDWYSQITPHLWLGGAPVTEADYQRIVDSGIDSVLNIRAERTDDTGFYDRHGISHLQVRVPDVTVPDPDSITAGTDWIRDRIGDGRVVLVHCAKGRGRSATLAAAYLMRDLGYSYEEAKRMLDERRPLTKLEPKHEAVLSAWLAAQARSVGESSGGAEQGAAGRRRRGPGDGDLDT